MPFEVPESWEWCRLGEVISVKSGKNIKVGKLDFLEKYPVYGGNGINGSYHQFNVEAKTLIIGRVGFYCGSIHKTFKKSWITDNALIVSLNYENIFELDFLYYLLINLNLGKTSNSTAQPVISGKGILPQLVAIPPLKEQKRIISQIERLFHLIEIIEESNSSIEQTVSQTKSKVLELAIKGKLVPQDPENEPASTLLEQLEIKKASSDKSHYPFELPNGWEVTEMQNICSLLDGEKRNDISLPYLDVKFLRNQSGINLKKSGKFVSAETNLVLVDGENSGEIFKTNIDGYQGSTLKIIQISEEINEEYIFYILKKEHKLFKESKTGSAIPHLNKKLFREYPIPLPPLAEQQRIVFQIENIFAQLEIIENSLKA